MEALWTLAGVFFGGAIGIGGNLIDRWRQRVVERRGVAAAIAAEIESVIHLTDVRGYVESYQGWIDTWKKGERLDIRPASFVDVPAQEAFPVACANLNAVGHLGPELARDVTKFYNTTSSVRLDLVSVSDPKRPVDECTSIIEEALTMWRDAEPLGRDLVRRLQKV